MTHVFELAEFLGWRVKTRKKPRRDPQKKPKALKQGIAVHDAVWVAMRLTRLTMISTKDCPTHLSNILDSGMPECPREVELSGATETSCRIRVLSPPDRGQASR